MSLETEHKGFKIKYNEEIDSWEAVNEEGRKFEEHALRFVKEDIDKYLKKKAKKKFKRISGFNSQFRPLDITSIVSVGHGYSGEKQVEVWVSYKDKEGKDKFLSMREKTTIGRYRTIYKDTPENREKIERIKALKAEQAELEEKLEQITAEEVIAEEGGE